MHQLRNICSRVFFKDDVAQKERKRFTIKSKPYTLYGENLYKLGPNGIIHQCFSPLKQMPSLPNFVMDCRRTLWYKHNC
jgi:hypothetical protein